MEWTEYHMKARDVHMKVQENLMKWTEYHMKWTGKGQPRVLSARK